MPDQVSLRVTTSDSIAEVALLGPGKGNAMGPDFWRECPRVFAELDRDESVRAVIVRGEGSHFTYGLDLPAMMGDLGPMLTGDAMAAGRSRLYDKILELQGAFTAIASCRKPVIAAVHGWCIGGGVDLITACDIRLCSRDARFSVREVRVARVADLGSLQRLPAIVGEGHARELAMTGRDFPADHALRIGLVNEVHESPEALLTAARALARSISENPPLVVQGIKKVMDEALAPRVDRGLRHVAAWNAAFLPSQDLGEAMQSFMERRPPQFTGK
jgi:enoyl-CoA hydratase